MGPVERLNTMDSENPKNAKYVIIDTGYTSRIAEGCKKYKLVIKVGKKDKTVNADMKKLGDKMSASKGVEPKNMEPLVVMDNLWGKGVYINTKANQCDVAWVLKNIDFTCGTVVFSLGKKDTCKSDDSEDESDDSGDSDNSDGESDDSDSDGDGGDYDESDVTEYIRDKEYCNLFDQLPTRYITFKDACVAYIGFDSESG